MERGTCRHPALRLEPLRLEHLPHVMTWVNDHEVLAYFAGRQMDIGEAEERRYLEGLIASPNDRAFSVFDGENYVGQCSVNQIYWPASSGRLFLVIRRELQGRGYGSAALLRLMDLAWTDLGLHKLWLIVRRDNREAQSLYLRLGFDFEGVLRDEYRVQGQFHDMVRMARLAPVP
jgi:diamine N-acetyltransferase